jgi:flagellar motor switch protein FliN/FliY
MPMADESQRIDQDEIEQLLAQAARAAGPPAPPKPAPAASPKSDDPFDKLLGQGDVEALFQQAVAPGASKPAPPPPPAPAARSPAHAAPTFARDEGVAPADVELLLQQAERAIASLDEAAPPPPGVAPFSLEDFVGAPPNADRATLDLIRDVELDLKIEFGRTHMYLEDVLKLRKGSVVPLDKLAGDPVDIFVNGRLIAKGEVLVLNDNFCVRVAELIAGEAMR